MAIYSVLTSVSHMSGVSIPAAVEARVLVRQPHCTARQLHSRLNPQRKKLFIFSCGPPLRSTDPSILSLSLSLGNDRGEGGSEGELPSKRIRKWKGTNQSTSRPLRQFTRRAMAGARTTPGTDRRGSAGAAAGVSRRSVFLVFRLGGARSGRSHRLPPDVVASGVRQNLQPPRRLHEVAAQCVQQQKRRSR